MRSISLIGFMGSGKSCVGKELAELLPDMELIDLDDYIEAMTGRTISDIFEKDGEAAFREMEKSALENIFLTEELTGAPCILSLGGGTVTTEACRKMVRRNTTCFYLKASIDTLVANLTLWPGDRPMLRGRNGLRSRVKELMADRVPLYEETAHHIIDVDGSDYHAAAIEILNHR
ncbi:MAG: shikimate kinase, partial [Bacteroidales bacterium]|nr:shikimate kinase [Bacteroidales bacterium]